MIKETVRLLRKKQTDAEAVLWRHLRNRRTCGKKFVRQYPFQIEYMQRNRFIVVDFYCHTEKLAIEIDGSYHDGRAKIDKHHKDLLMQKEIRVIRFGNNEVLNNITMVLQKIKDSITSKDLPSLLREG